MSAGLPGFGLGGLFFILTALAAPLIELARTARGRSSGAAWRGVARQFTMAVLMIAAVDLSVRGFLGAIDLFGADGAARGGITVLPVGPIAISAAILGTLLAGAAIAAWAMRARQALRHRPVRARRLGRRLAEAFGSDG